MAALLPISLDRGPEDETTKNGPARAHSIQPDFQLLVIPEPSALFLVAIGLVFVPWLRRQ